MCDALAERAFEGPEAECVGEGACGEFFAGKFYIEGLGERASCRTFGDAVLELEFDQKVDAVAALEIDTGQANVLNPGEGFFTGGQIASDQIIKDIRVGDLLFRAWERTTESLVEGVSCNLNEGTCGSCSKFGGASPVRSPVAE